MGVGVASASVCRREKGECEQRSATAAAQGRLKLHHRRRGGLWGEERDKAAAREFLGQGALGCERNHHRRKAEEWEREEPGRAGEQHKVARASNLVSLLLSLFLVT